MATARLGPPDGGMAPLSPAFVFRGNSVCLAHEPVDVHNPSHDPVLHSRRAGQGSVNLGIPPCFHDRAHGHRCAVRRSAFRCPGETPPRAVGSAVDDAGGVRFVGGFPQRCFARVPRTRRRGPGVGHRSREHGGCRVRARRVSRLGCGNEFDDAVRRQHRRGGHPRGSAEQQQRRPRGHIDVSGSWRPWPSRQRRWPISNRNVVDGAGPGAVLGR